MSELEAQELTRPDRVSWRWWRLLLAAVAAVLVGLLGAGTASAATVTVAETRVGASTVATAYVVGVHECIIAGQRWGNAPPQAVSVAGCGVAANGESRLAPALSEVRANPERGSIRIRGGRGYTPRGAAGDYDLDESAQAGTAGDG